MSDPRRAAVLGHPVAHSLSPALHRAAYASLGFADWRYDAIDVTSDHLGGFIAALDASWAGLSLTMPLKQTILPFLNHVEPLAEVVGAVNTVLIQSGGRSLVLTGANTDVHGIVAALREAATVAGVVIPERPTAAVIGAGATAASTLAAFGELGCSTPTVFVRSMARVGGLMRAAHRMGVEPRFAVLDSAAGQLADVDLVVSTVPAHAADGLAEALVRGAGPDGDASRPPEGGADVHGILLDVVYDPRPTRLMQVWGTLGGVVTGGERMLLFQAAEQVRLMTGRPAPVGDMDLAIQAVLAR